GTRVRRLVTLGSPYYSERRPAQELAIFAAHDQLVPPPGDRRGRVVVVEDCGHLNLLLHPTVLHAVSRFLRMTVASGLLAEHTNPSSTIVSRMRTGAGDGMPLAGAGAYEPLLEGHRHTVTSARISRCSSATAGPSDPEVHPRPRPRLEGPPCFVAH